MKLLLSPKARDYVRREARYLKSASPRAAQQFLNDFKRLQQALRRFPEMGKVNDELPIPGVFRFVMGEYLIDYELTDDRILIFAIRHGRERPPRVEMDEDFDFET